MEILGAQMPSISLGAGFHIDWVLLAIVFCVFFTGAILIYLYFQMKTFNKRIEVYENISGQGYQLIYKDRARVVKVGDGGEELLFLKKAKLYRTAYGRKMGKNLYWFAKGQDGYWYNVVLGDLDAKMGMLDIEPIDRDMRYMHEAIRKNIERRYRKENFMDKYGAVMMSGIFLLIMLAGLWILISKMGDIATSINLGIDAAAQVQQGSAQILSSLDNIVNGGSGIIQVK